MTTKKATKKTATKKTMTATTKKTAVRSSGTFVPDLGTLAGRAILVNLTMHWWSPRAADRDLSTETEKKWDTNGTFQKELLDKENVSPVHSAKKNVERTHAELTLPWEDGGTRILSSAGYLSYEKKMRAAVNEYLEAAELQVIGPWSSLIKEKERTDKSFKPEHYPSVNEIRSRFGADIRYKPIPQGSDLRTALADDALAAVKASIDSDQEDRIKAAVFNIAERVQDVLRHMVDTLNKYKPAVKENGKPRQKAESTFRDSLVSNVADLGNLLPTLNVTGDPRIDAIAAEMLKLSTVSPDTLRDDEKTRTATISAADKILERVSDFI